jgi:U3 small nucleolar RNA-associated protein 14
MRRLIVIKRRRVRMISNRKRVTRSVLLFQLIRFRTTPTDPSFEQAKPASRSNATANAEIDLDEEEVDPDDEAGDGFVDASDLLDMGVYASDDSDDDEEIASGSGSEDDDDDDDMASVDSESEVDSEYEGALDKLGSFVEQLESRKRKNAGDDYESPFGDEAGKKKKRVVLKERTEAYPEGEFVAVGAHDGEDDGASLCLYADEPS